MGLCGYNILGKRNRRCKGMIYLGNYMVFFMIFEFFLGNKIRDMGKGYIMNVMLKILDFI